MFEDGARDRSRFPAHFSRDVANSRGNVAASSTAFGPSSLTGGGSSSSSASASAAAANIAAPAVAGSGSASQQSSLSSSSFAGLPVPTSISSSSYSSSKGHHPAMTLRPFGRSGSDSSSFHIRLTKSELRCLKVVVCVLIVLLVLTPFFAKAWTRHAPVEDEVLPTLASWTSTVAARKPRPYVGQVAFNASKLHYLDHLIMVAGHAVVLAESLDDVEIADSPWYLESYQRGRDLPQALVHHIRSGVEAAAADARSLLVFSGGQTRASAGPRDEGSSYYRIAEHFGWWGHINVEQTQLSDLRLRGSSTSRAGQEEFLPVVARAVTEDFASDSFQNLLFSLCRFKEVVGHYPNKVTVVGFTFKKHRFVSLHRSALRIPSDHFSYIGVQPPEHSRFNLKEAEEGEWTAAVKSFQVDPYGCFTPELQAKRLQRNPFHRTTPYPLSCPEMKSLLAWCGPGIFADSLPWDPRDGGRS